MKTTLLTLCTLVLAQALVEARYGSSGGSGSPITFVSAGAGSGSSAGGYGSSSGGYGGGSSGSNALGNAGDSYTSEQGTFGLGGGSVMHLSMPSPDQVGPSYHQSGGSPVSAAVQTKRTVEVKPVRVPEDHAEPHVVDVEASVQPVHVIFRSASNPIMVNQIHKPAEQGKVERTESEDEPHRVQHRVTRPIIQQVHEIIQPYRKVLQEIRPVVEDIRTVVAKSSDGPGGPGAGAGPSDGGAYGGNGGLGGGNGGNGGGYGGRSDSGNFGGNLGGGAGSYGGLGGNAGNSVSYSDSIPSMSVLPSPAKYRSRKAHSRRLSSAKRYSRRA